MNEADSTLMKMLLDEGLDRYTASKMEDGLRNVIRVESVDELANVKDTDFNKLFMHKDDIKRLMEIVKKYAPSPSSDGGGKRKRKYKKHKSKKRRKSKSKKYKIKTRRKRR